MTFISLRDYKDFLEHCKVRQGQPRIIIFANLLGPKFPILHIKIIGLLILDKILESFYNTVSHFSYAPHITCKITQKIHMLHLV